MTAMGTNHLLIHKYTIVPEFPAWVEEKFRTFLATFFEIDFDSPKEKKRKIHFITRE